MESDTSGLKSQLSYGVAVTMNKQPNFSESWESQLWKKKERRKEAGGKAKGRAKESKRERRNRKEDRRKGEKKKGREGETEKLEKREVGGRKEMSFLVGVSGSMSYR